MKRQVKYLGPAMVIMLLAAGMATGAEERKVGKLFYANCGMYITSPLWLHWKIDGNKHTKRLDRSLTTGRYTCVDLARYDVPKGAEVWLSYQIVAGEKESCRKDDVKFYYEPGSPRVQDLYSKGTTLNNNRCRVEDWYVPVPDKCESDGDAESWFNDIAC